MDDPFSSLKIFILFSLSCVCSVCRIAAYNTQKSVRFFISIEYAVTGHSRADLSSISTDGH